MAHPKGKPIVAGSHRGNFHTMSIPVPSASVFIPTMRDAQPLAPKVRKFVRFALSESTLRGYRNDLRHFLNWGGTIPCSDTVIAEYLADHATTHAVATLFRRLTAINKAHYGLGLPVSPGASLLVKSTIRGISRLHGKPQRRARPITKALLYRVLGGIKTETNEQISARRKVAHRWRALRDRAMILLGFAGALRCKEIVETEYDDLRWTKKGVVIHLKRSKMDQFGNGAKVAIPYASGPWCPVKALRAWLDISGIAEGPLFRKVNPCGGVWSTGFEKGAVSWILKQRLSDIGWDPADYSAHSLRAGFVTSAIKAGVPTIRVSLHTRHKHEDSLLRYVRNERPFHRNAAAEIL